MTTKPIFIGGLFKSGTSLLRAMLGQHSHIAAGLETYWFEVDWDARLGRDEEPLADYVERMAGFFDIEIEWAHSAAEKAESASAFVTSILNEFAIRQGKPRWAEKTPGNILHVSRIKENWPGAKIIHIIRDPRDVYASLRQAKKWDSVEMFGNLWCDFMGAGARAASVVHEMRYEDLTLNPEECMRKAIQFVGEPWEPGVAEFSGRSEDYDKVMTLSGHASSTLDRLRHPLTNNRIGIWRDLIAADELKSLRDFVADCGLGDAYDQVTEAAVTSTSR
tara:strand:+ start:805 stop:1635 length:831 start_codon:yes stop_codon:yes gene_type:complete